jgi:hypothetical protein
MQAEQIGNAIPNLPGNKHLAHGILDIG